MNTLHQIYQERKDPTLWGMLFVIFVIVPLVLWLIYGIATQQVDPHNW